MRKFWVTGCIFASGSNFHHLLDGGTDTLFGTHWMLAVYVVAGVIIGWVDMPPLAVTPAHGQSPSSSPGK